MQQPDFLPVPDPEGLDVRAHAIDLGGAGAELRFEFGQARAQPFEVVILTRLSGDERGHVKMIANASPRVIGITVAE